MWQCVCECVCIFLIWLAKRFLLANSNSGLRAFSVEKHVLALCITHTQTAKGWDKRTDREREGEAAPTHWQIDMHSAVVGALLLFEVRNAPPKQDTHTYAHWHIKQSCLPASLLLIICKYVHAHMYIYLCMCMVHMVAPTSSPLLYTHTYTYN